MLKVNRAQNIQLISPHVFFPFLVCFYDIILIMIILFNFIYLKI